MLDVVIRGGRLIDGTGCPWVRADVGIEGGRVACVGRLAREPAKRVIDADGLVVSPGFVDMHTHSDLQLLADPHWELKLRQGITLDVLGHDGLGLAPVDERTADLLAHDLRGWNGDPGIVWSWRGVDEYLARFDQAVAPNVAMLAPHGTIRLLAMGPENRPPSGAEMDSMRRLLTEALEDGCVGLSAGLTYAPGMYANDAELVELCRAMAPLGGFYAPHHRNYGSAALDAYRASIEIGRAAGVPVHLTHAHLGFPVNRGRAPELLTMIDTARAQGVEVTLDSYPYLAGFSYLHSYLPGWVQGHGSDGARRWLEDPAARERIRVEMELTGSDGFQGMPIDWSAVVVAGVANPALASPVGVSIADGAARDGRAPFDFYCDLVLQDDFGTSSLAHIGNENNVRTIMRHPAHMASSDGIVVGQRPHPRAWGSHVRFLAHYARDLELVRVEEMVRKMTSLPARRLGLFDRGVVCPGAAADVVCFDLDRLADRATYEHPREFAEGVVHVLVNGVAVIDDGSHTGALPGRALPPGRRVRLAA